MSAKYDVIALFSGGLDSIVAVKVLEEQGLKVKCLHFVSPFFGKPHSIEHWRKVYTLDLDMVDVSAAFVHMLHQRPAHGFGKLLNPCVDCKILMMRHTKELMEHYGASCVASGEVLGQRPMSQRRDTLNVIRRESGLMTALLRPLSALIMDPTEAELSGLVDRSRLHGISGRGRKGQLDLAKRYGITEIPSPAGGCRLTEQENACRYWKVLETLPRAEAEDFELAHTGRQLWSDEARGRHWLCIGRNAASNGELERLARPGDLIFKLRDFAGPLALGRQLELWDAATVQEAAAMVASFAPQAVRHGGETAVCVYDARQGLTGIATGGANIPEPASVVTVFPARESTMKWREPRWDEAREAVRAEMRNATK